MGSFLRLLGDGPWLGLGLGLGVRVRARARVRVRVRARASLLGDGPFAAVLLAPRRLVRARGLGLGARG